MKVSPSVYAAFWACEFGANVPPLPGERKTLFGSIIWPVSGTPRRRPSALVRVDQVLLAGRALGINGDMVELQRLLQRHHLRVTAGEGRLEFIDHPLAQLCSLSLSNFHQEGSQQPTADAPGHAECTVQLGRTCVESAIDIDLLVHVRSVAAV